jgi:hypothetical protein
MEALAWGKNRNALMVAVQTLCDHSPAKGTAPDRAGSQEPRELFGVMKNGAMKTAL